MQAVKAPRLVTASLAFAAGVVDACTYRALFGLFVAQVTGSFVIIGVQLIRLDPTSLIRVTAIPFFFVSGFITAVLVALAARPRPALCWALAAEMVLLCGFVASGLFSGPFVRPNDTFAVIASVLGIAAVGVQSGMVRLVMRGVSSTNVMTTNTTQAALDLAHWTGTAWRAARYPHDEGAKIARRRARAHFGQLWPVLVGFLTGTHLWCSDFQRDRLLVPADFTRCPGCDFGVDDVLWSGRLRRHTHYDGGGADAAGGSWHQAAMSEYLPISPSGLSAALAV